MSIQISQHNKFRSQRLLWSMLVIALLGAAWFVYRPGMAGDFLFDDFNNLPAIGATGPANRLDTLTRYLTSGTADPTGRPLTLATFLLDSRHWPAPPHPFLRTNILLHLLNGLLLFQVLTLLGKEIRLAVTHARLAAFFGSGAWLLHPLLVSTTLYVVQREAMLPATFTLLGIAGWIRSRKKLQRGHHKSAVACMAAVVGVGTLFATLAKGNGALLPLFILIIEWVVLARTQPMPSCYARKLLKVSVGVLLVLPSIVLLAWMVVGIPGYMHGTPLLRDWTMPQRLLSEPRAIADYLGMLFLIKQPSYGLFTDAFPPSTGWFHPWTTLGSVLLITALLSISLVTRKRLPAVALAMLFYFAGHLLESTWLPLELYYEHRNYQPSLMLFWPLGVLLGAPGHQIWIRRVAGMALLVALVIQTSERVTLWADGYQQAQMWAALNPKSARAQAAAAQYQMAHDQPRLAAARLKLALTSHPNDLQISVNLIGAQCRSGGTTPQALNALRAALSTTRNGGTLGFDWLNTAIDMATQKSCPGLDLATVQSFIDAGRRNPNWATIPGWRQDMLHLQGLLDLAEGKPQAALQAFNEALAQTAAPDTALKQAAILGSNGLPLLGLAHLDYWQTLPPPPPPPFGMQRLHVWVLAKQGYWKHEASSLRATLATDAASVARQSLQPVRD